MAGPYELQSPKDIAMEYGGNKQKIAQAAQMGLLDPTSAVLAGMFIDRMRNAQQEEMAPQQTVAQEVMAPQQPQMAGLPGAQMAARMPAEAGVAALPVPEDMYSEDSFAGGGIVAFANGGDPREKILLGYLTNPNAPAAVKELNPDYVLKAFRESPEDKKNSLLAQLSAPSIATPQKTGTGAIFDRPDVDTTNYTTAEEIEAYRPRGIKTLFGLVPEGVGSGNINYELKMLGYTNAQIAKMDPAMKRYILAKVASEGTPTPGIGMPTGPEAAKTEAIIAQAERGEGPNVSRPSQLPADQQVNRTPQGLTPQDTPFAASTEPSEVALITQESKSLIPKQGLSVEDFKARQAAFGITDDVDADLKKQIDALAAGTKTEREQAKYMAMLQAGLGIMGGTSPYALQNIATGAQKGVAQYASDIKDIKKEERDLMKMRGELARAEDARKRGDFKSYMDAEDKARTYELNLAQQATRERLADIQADYAAGRLSLAQAQAEAAKQRNNLLRAETVRKARKQFMDEGGESRLRSEFVKRFGKDWEKDPMLMQSFKQQIDEEINKLAMMGTSGIPFADDLLGN